MRQHIARLLHQVDTQIVVFDTDMYVHAADHEALRHTLEIACKNLIALFLCMLLLTPGGKRMRRCRDDRQAVLFGHL